MSNVPTRQVESLMRAYPRIFFACHQRHVRDPGSGDVLSRNQADILQHLDPVEPVSVGDLADHMGVSISTMSLNTKRLERDGYVYRSRAESDGRVVHLRLTESGERVRDAQEVLDRDRVRELLAELGAEDRRRALDGLELLGDAAGRLGRPGGNETEQSAA